MEDFDLDYEESAMPYMKASVDIPLKLLRENIEKVSSDLYEFSNNITDGKLLIRVVNDENGNCCFEADKSAGNSHNIGEYDLEISREDEEFIKVLIFKFAEASIVSARYNGLNYMVNLRE